MALFPPGIATNFAQIATSMGTTSGNGQSGVSYFVCGDASDPYPQMILDGDRNIGTTTAANTVANNTNTTSVGQWAYNKYWAWTGDLHQKAGNIGLADGSVEQVSIFNLQKALVDATNTASVAQPWYNFPN